MWYVKLEGKIIYNSLLNRSNSMIWCYSPVFVNNRIIGNCSMMARINIKSILQCKFRLFKEPFKISDSNSLEARSNQQIKGLFEIKCNFRVEWTEIIDMQKQLGDIQRQFFECRHNNAGVWWDGPRTDWKIKACVSWLEAI